MNTIARLAILLLFTLLTSAAVAQKRTTPAKPQPTPAPTFDNLVPADAYAIYAEVRDAGQLVRASAINDLLEPVLKLAGPPKEFKSIVKFLNAHAEELMSSRLLVATWNINKTVPETLVAIEFASPEEATKFATPLNEFLPKVLAKPTPDTAAKNLPPDPDFHLERLGSLVVITQRPWTMKQLRPAGSKSLTDAPNFRTAHSRFSSEPIFVFVDFKLMNREEEERRKQAEEEGRKALEQAKQNPNQIVTTRDVTDAEIAEQQSTAVITPKDAPTPDPISTSLSAIGNSFFSGELHTPDAVALALAYEGESFDLRGLLISAPGEKIDAIPFWPNIIAGTPITPEVPSVFPADTELFVMMSLDLPQIYSALSKPRKSEYAVSKGNRTQITRTEFESPFKPIEKKLELSIENDLLPLLGSEIAVAFPLNGLNMFGLPGPGAAEPEKKENEKDQPANSQTPILAISVRDKERVRALLPKLIEGLGFKGANQFATTERRDDTEIVSYANLFAYAFVGNFLVLSADAATTRHVVDSYLKQETLASDVHYQTYTRWQPRQLQGQVYVSRSLMEGYRTWAALPTTRISDQMRNFMTSASLTSQPIAYSLSNEGLGPLHELHLPKNLVSMIVASISGEVNAPPALQQERAAIGTMYTIAFAEEQYRAKKGAGSYGTLEDLIAAQLFSKENLEGSGYRFELTASGDKFEASAVPLDYGKSGILSLFIDHTRVLRGGDHGGATATASDPPIANQ